MNGTELLDKMELIDAAYVESAAAVPKRQNRRWIGWGVAAACLCLVIGAAVIITKTIRPNDTTAFFDAVEIPDDAVMPPVREGSSQSETQYRKLYNYASAYDEADAVCIVTVGNWLSEFGMFTLFDAKVEKVYKGSIPDKIVLLQNENSKYHFTSPVFSYGNRLLVFLNSWDRWGENAHYDNAYAMIGPDYTTLYLSYDNSKKAYLIALNGFAGSLGEESGIYLKNSRNVNLLNELDNYIKKTDSYLAEQIEKGFDEDEFTRVRIYALSDFEEFFDSRN